MVIQDYVVDKKGIDQSTDLSIQLWHDTDFVELKGPMTVSVTFFHRVSAFDPFTYDRTDNIKIALGETRKFSLEESDSEDWNMEIIINPVNGGTGNDTFHSSIGNDTFDGCAGVDTVIFSSHLSDYSIASSGIGFAISDNIGSDGVDTIFNIEKLKFSDHTLFVVANPNEPLFESYRIYKAAFDRLPDYAGLGYWYKAMEDGASLIDIAGGFINSDEFRSMYGNNPTDETFVSLLYQHVLGRSLDQLGYNFWLDDLRVETRAQVLAHFSESPENIANLAGVALPGIIYEEYMG